MEPRLHWRLLLSNTLVIQAGYCTRHAFGSYEGNMFAIDDIKNFNFASIAFELTDRCPIRCRSCLRECSPKKHSVMHFDRIRSVLENLGTKGSFREVGFSGGECFMLPEFLLELCTFINKDLSLPVVMSTNAFWAKDKETADQVILPLAKNGLKNLMVSIDDFHLEYINIDNIRNCVIAAIKNNIQVTLQVVLSKSSRKTEDLKKELDLNINEAMVTWVETPCDPIGRAPLEIPQDEFIRKGYTERSFCSILKLLSVRLDGSVVPCCGSGAEALGLVIGNIWEETIDDIIDRVNVSPIMNLLALHGGPLALIKELEKIGISSYAERQYTSPCDACFQIFDNKETTSALQEALKNRWVDYYSMRIGWQTKLIQHLRDLKKKGLEQ
jgi:organic radical activating enzyme